MKLASGAYARAALRSSDYHKYSWTGDGVAIGDLTQQVLVTTEIGTTDSVNATRYRPLNGDDPDAAVSATVRTFVAGALVGVAGGTLVATVELTVRWIVRRRRPVP